MARLPTVSTGLSGQIAHTNQAYELLNQLQHSGGSRMINVLDPPAAVSATAAVGDGSTDDSTALQTIFDFLKGTPAGAYWVWFPFRNAAGITATYMTSKPLRVWTNTRIVGPATIKAHSTFDWVNHPYWQDALYKPVGVQQPGDIALMELWNDSSARGTYSRIFIEDITLNGNNQAGSLGLLSKMQQPGYTRKLRIDKCLKAGWALWGQQSDHILPVIVDCPVGLYLGPDIGGLGLMGTAGSDCKFMSFYGINVETYLDAAIRMNCDGPNWFYSLHAEGTPAATNSHVIDAQEGSWTLYNGWATHPGDTNHVFVIGDKTPMPNLKDTTYTVKNFRLNATNTTGQKMIDDKVRSFTRLVDLQNHIGDFQTMYQHDTQHDYDAAFEILGDEGGTVRIGGIKGGTAAPTGHSGAQLTVRSNVAQDERSVRFLDTGGVLRSGIHQTGNMVLGAYSNSTRPAATTLEAGTGIWNTDDNAPNYSDGTIWRDAQGTST